MFWELSIMSKLLFYFFRCVHCGCWYYSSKKIKTKKCIKCNKSFKFENAKKMKRQCSLQEAITIIKQLKEPKIRELIQFITILEG